MKKIHFRCCPEEFASIRHEAEKFLTREGFDEMRRALLVLALDEACSNVYRHAYDRRPDCTATLTMLAGPERVVFYLRDHGKNCPASQIRGRDLHDFRPGGLGVYMIREAFDRVDWLPKKEGTLLRLIAERSRPAGPGFLK
jgi:anti-sigma regulatory factor (Ser/Thr protein kinase)